MRRSCLWMDSKLTLLPDTSRISLIDDKLVAFSWPKTASKRVSLHYGERAISRIHTKLSQKAHEKCSPKVMLTMQAIGTWSVNDGFLQGNHILSRQSSFRQMIRWVDNTCLEERVNKACYLLTSSEYRSWNWCVEANLIKTKHITAFAKSALNSHRYGDWLEARTRYINWLPVIDDHPKTSLLALLPPWARLLISQTITIQSNPACRLEWLSVDHLREIAEECIRDEDFAPA